MKTGWAYVGNSWYYLRSSGAMSTGWVKDNGKWYYLASSGNMLRNTRTPDGYYVDGSGAWK
jgi:choline binding protein pcpA